MTVRSARITLKKVGERTTFPYAMADAAYDAEAIKDLVCRQGRRFHHRRQSSVRKNEESDGSSPGAALPETLRSGMDLFPSQGRVRRDDDLRERKLNGRISFHICHSSPDGRSASSSRLPLASEHTQESLSAPVSEGMRKEFSPRVA